jgi:hypothetical protein
VLCESWWVVMMMMMMMPERGADRVLVVVDWLRGGSGKLFEIRVVASSRSSRRSRRSSRSSSTVTAATSAVLYQNTSPSQSQSQYQYSTWYQQQQQQQQQLTGQGRAGLPIEELSVCLRIPPSFVLLAPGPEFRLDPGCALTSLGLGFLCLYQVCSTEGRSTACVIGQWQLCRTRISRVSKKRERALATSPTGGGIYQEFLPGRALRQSEERAGLMSNHVSVKTLLHSYCTRVTFVSGYRPPMSPSLSKDQ